MGKKKQSQPNEEPTEPKKLKGPKQARRETVKPGDSAGQQAITSIIPPEMPWTSEYVNDLKKLHAALRPLDANGEKVHGYFATVKREAYAHQARMMLARLDPYGYYQELLDKARLEIIPTMPLFNYEKKDPSPDARDQVDKRGEIILNKDSFEALDTFIKGKLASRGK